MPVIRASKLPVSPRAGSIASLSRVNYSAPLRDHCCLRHITRSAGLVIEGGVKKRKKKTTTASSYQVCPSKFSHLSGINLR